MSFTLEKTRTYSIRDASGSALKGVGFFSKRSDIGSTSFLGLCSVGYDQRLYVWRMSPSYYDDDGDNTGGVKKLIAGQEGCPLEWVCGTMVNIGDVNSMSLLEKGMERQEVVVVGEGFQLFELGNTQKEGN